MVNLIIILVSCNVLSTVAKLFAPQSVRLISPDLNQFKQWYSYVYPDQPMSGMGNRKCVIVLDYKLKFFDCQTQKNRLRQGLATPQLTND